MTSKSPKAQGKSLKRAVLTGSLLQNLFMGAQATPRSVRVNATLSRRYTGSA